MAQILSTYKKSMESKNNLTLNEKEIIKKKKYQNMLYIETWIRKTCPQKQDDEQANSAKPRAVTEMQSYPT